MDLKLLIVLLGALFAAVFAEKARFDNYRVYKVLIENEKQLETLKEIENRPDGYLFWEMPVAVGMDILLMVPPHKFGEFSQLASKLQFKHTIQLHNIQEIIDEEDAAYNKNNRAAEPRFGWTQYHTLDEINAWLDSLVAKYPSIVSPLNAGSSFQGRQLKGVKVSYKSGNPGVFIEANIHAREWVTSAAVTWMLNALLTSTNADVRNIAENYDWYIFPVINPDGFVYTKTNDRMWRKTRSINGLCYGADPNRNWGYKWMQGGASNQPCSDTYAGKSAFSEIETKSMSNYYSALVQKTKISTYLSFHSYSQLLLLPYGHTTAPLDNYFTAMDIGRKAIAKLAQRYGTQYKIGNIAEAIYVASGGSIDWVKGVHRTPLAYCYELRDTGRYGFLLPPNQIIPTAEETLDSIIVMLAEGKKYGYH